MDKQELRESIFYIIMSRKFTDSFGDEMGIDEEVAKQLADALIAAGLKFDGEWKHKFEVAQKKLEKWQNIYFLALKNAIKFYGIELCPIECPFQYHFCGSDDCINLLAENFMQQAEQELAEEKKE